MWEGPKTFCGRMQYSVDDDYLEISWDYKTSQETELMHILYLQQKLIRRIAVIKIDL